MIIINDQELFGEVIAEAVKSVHVRYAQDTKARDRWIQAIGKAVRTLEGDTTDFNYDANRNAVICRASKSDQSYIANGTCQCKAFLENNPCYHRAMKVLVENYTRRTREICAVKIFSTNFKSLEITTEKWIFGLKEAKVYLERQLEDSPCAEKAWIENDLGETIHKHVFPEPSENAEFCY